MGMIRSDFTQRMTDMMYEWTLESYDSLAPVYPQIFDVKEATKGSYDKSVVGVGLGKLTEKKEGEPIKYSKLSEGWEVITKYRTFADGVLFSMEAMEDDPIRAEGLLRDAIDNWNQLIINTKEEFAASFFNYGGFTAGHDVFNNSITGLVEDKSGNFVYDGKPFFNLTGNKRTAKNGSEYYNAIATANLDSTNLQTAYTLMTNTNNRNERGEIVRIVPDTLLIPPTLKFTAASLLESTAITGGSSATLTKNTVENLVKPIEWAYLTSSTAWYLGQAKKGLTWYERKVPVFDFYQDEDTKDYKLNVHARWGASVKNWRYWVGNNIATS